MCFVTFNRFVLGWSDGQKYFKCILRCRELNFAEFRAFKQTPRIYITLFMHNYRLCSINIDLESK